MTAQVGSNSLAKQSQFCFICRHSFRRSRTQRWQFFPPRCAVIEVGQFILGERRHWGTCSFFSHSCQEWVCIISRELVNGHGRDWWLAAPCFVPKVAVLWVFDWSYISEIEVLVAMKGNCVYRLPQQKPLNAFSLLAGSLPQKGYYRESGLSSHSVHEWIHNDFLSPCACFICLQMLTGLTCQHVAKEWLEA